MRNLPEPADVIYLQDVDSRINSAPKKQEPYHSLFYRARGPFPHTHGYIIYRDHAHTAGIQHATQVSDSCASGVKQIYGTYML